MCLRVKAVISKVTANRPKSTGAKESGSSTDATMDPPPRPSDMKMAAQVIIRFTDSGGTSLEQMLSATARAMPALTSTMLKPTARSEMRIEGRS